VFEADQTLQIQGRTYVRQQSMFKQFWNSIRVVHSTTRMYSLVIRPISAKRAADLWRMNTQNDYVKGEELLTTWAPRKVSLVRDYIAARKRRLRVAELHAARGALSAGSLNASSARSGKSTPMRGTDLNERKSKLLRKYLDLWSLKQDPTEAILIRSNTEPPTDGAASASHIKNSNDTNGFSDKISLKPRFVATIQTLPKNPSALKTGYVLTPDDTNNVWVRRFVELRRPYLHIYSVPEGDEINAINLRNSRVDHAPDFARLLDGSGAGADHSLSAKGRPNIFAVYGTQNTFLFATRTEAQKVEWILKIDESYFNSHSPSAAASSDGR
jgi:kinesin family protein 1